MSDRPSKLTEDMSESVRETLQRVSDDVAVLSDRARRGARRAAEYASDMAEEAAERGQRYARYAARQVKEHPVTTLAVGAAVGVIIAAVLMRKRD